MGDPSTPNQPKPSWPKLLGAILVIASLLLAAHFLGIRDLLHQLFSNLENYRPWDAVVFVAAYIAATVLMAPASILTLGAGAYFGLFWGSIYVSIASTLGAGAAFLIGRYIARNSVAKRIDGNQTFAAIDTAVAKEGWKIVALTRLSPAFPFNLLNYGFGLTKVRFFPYLIASWIAMMPGTIMFVYLGSLANTPSGRTPGQWALLIVGLLATIAATILITRSAKAALNDRLKTPSDQA